ncbi:hypothetical protein TrLO_g9307 [Triparma laevis f. longispina]|uniref:Uncharacterized protein n=1 Tax=Triparma laevis f. longispina TaxID=1714387 RepID=A0A9W7FF71_9STRA|nr:hypothetical protein TrLO_g9307 [Triparma laevis f. longispina]
MSNSVSSESTKRHLNPLTSRKRGGDDEEDEDDEGIIDLPPIDSSATLTTVSTVLATTDHLDNVDLLHTNLQELGAAAFLDCKELKSMTIPDSLQTPGRTVFRYCSKLVPSNIDVNDSDAVVAHLRSKQS